MSEAKILVCPNCELALTPHREQRRVKFLCGICGATLIGWDTATIDPPTNPTMDGIERSRHLTEAEIDERWCDWYYHHGKMKFSRCIHPKHGDDVPHEYEGDDT